MHVQTSGLRSKLPFENFQVTPWCASDNLDSHLTDDGGCPVVARLNPCMQESCLAQCFQNRTGHCTSEGTCSQVGPCKPVLKSTSFFLHMDQSLDRFSLPVQPVAAIRFSQLWSYYITQIGTKILNGVRCLVFWHARSNQKLQSRIWWTGLTSYFMFLFSPQLPILGLEGDS